MRRVSHIARRISARVVWCSLAVLSISCAAAPSNPTPSPRQETTLPKAAPRVEAAPAACPLPSPGSDVQATLDAVASCFHAAVLLLNREPAKDEPLADFLDTARSPAAAVLTLPDGVAVSYAIVEQQHDDYDDGRSDFVTTYRFSAPGHPETADTTIVLTVGGADGNE
jgi:hypothetical protein